MAEALDIQEMEKLVFEASIAKIAQRCRYDLYYLAKNILGYDLMEEHVHADVCLTTRAIYKSVPPEYELPESTGPTLGMNDQFIPTNNNFLFLLPRGTFKTSVVTIGLSCQFLLNEPNGRILLDSETYGKAKAFLAEIKGHMEQNYKFREVFKAIHGMYPNDSNRKSELLWTNTELNIAARTKPRKEPSISCAGVDVTKNGMHYDLIIGDDLHSEKNTTNREQIQQVIDHWKLAYSLLDPGCPMIIIGTRWDFNDLYQHILDNERERFNILIRKAIRDDGTLLFPERLSQQFLDATRKTQGTSIFSKQYQNEPVDADTADFKHSYFKRKALAEVELIPMNWYLQVDPSYEGKSSDYAALTVVGMDYQRQLYLRYVMRGKMTYGEIINATFELFNKFPIKRIAFEVIGTKSLEFELQNAMKERNVWLPIDFIKHHPESKEERIRGLAPMYEFGHFYHVAECPQLEEYEDELLKFPRGRNDDIIDSVSMVLPIANPPQVKNSLDGGGRRKKSVYKPRSPITGV